MELENPMVSKDNYVIRNVIEAARTILQDRITRYSLYYLLLMGAIAIIGPYITPYEYAAQQYSDQGLARLVSPSSEFWLGTTYRGEDVFSRIIYGTRPTMVTGVVGGSLIIGIGASIGITAGYVGGRVESILMRFTDFVYGVPLIPFAIVLIAFLDVGFWASILVISLIVWRSNARVLRSQVLQIKERPFIMAAKASGASTPRIIFRHILPNVASMIILFFAIGAGTAMLMQAGLTFIGVSTPFIPSWGVMIRNAYNSGMLAQALWWSLPPGIFLSLTVLATFLLGRGYERITQGTTGSEAAEL